MNLGGTGRVSLGRLIFTVERSVVFALAVRAAPPPSPPVYSDQRSSTGGNQWEERWMSPDPPADRSSGVADRQGGTI